MCALLLSTINISPWFARTGLDSVQTAADLAILRTLSHGAMYQEEIKDNNHRLKLLAAKSVECLDPDLNQAFEEMQRRMGFDDKIELRIVDQNMLKQHDALTSQDIDFIFVLQNNPKVVYVEQSFLRVDNKREVYFTLVRELEHCKQYLKYKDSFSQENADLRKIAADASLAGFLDCFSCILSFMNGNMSAGTSYGIYGQRAVENRVLCCGCTKALYCVPADQISYKDFLVLFDEDAYWGWSAGKLLHDMYISNLRHCS